VLAALRASPAVEIVGVLRSSRIEAWRRYRASGLAYAFYLGCLMARRLHTEGIPILSTADVNGAHARAFVDRLAPDLLVSAFFNQKIDTALPAVNIHPSLLPAFKGVDPVFHARLAAAPLGVTVHRISPQLDAGDVVAQREILFGEEKSVLHMTERLYAEGARLLIESLPAIERATPQSGPGSYDSWPSRAQVAALRAKGVRLVRLRELLARAA
jgi:methionyl-tRNA formyltransferase